MFYILGSQIMRRALALDPISPLLRSTRLSDSSNAPQRTREIQSIDRTPASQSRLASTPLDIAEPFMFSSNPYTAVSLYNSLLRSITALWLISLAIVAQAQSTPTSYRLTPVPVLPGYTSGYPVGINDAGDVSGYCQPAVEGSNYEGFVLRNGVLSAVGKMPKKGNNSSAAYVSPTGVIVGSADTGDFRPQGFVKTGANMINVFPNKGGNTHALRIDAAGKVYGYFIGGRSAGWQGAVWTPTTRAGVYTQTILPGAAMPVAFNALGQAAGYTNTSPQTATFWSHLGTRPIKVLPKLPTWGTSVAYGIADNADVVGSAHPAFSSLPVIWRSATGHLPELLPFLAGDNYGQATAANQTGVIIGFGAFGQPGTWNIGPRHPVVWHGTIPHDLNSLLDPVTAAGWQIVSLVQVNNSGAILAAATFEGRQRAVVLTPIP